MQKVLSAAEMREVDRLTTERFGVPSLILMENAAHAAARSIVGRLGGSAAGKSVLVFCGRGNNGGDGAALGRILWTLGARVHVYLFAKLEDTKGDARTNFEILSRMTEDIVFWDDAAEANFDQLSADIELTHRFDVLVDALFGTGLTRPIEQPLAGIVDFAVNLLKYKESFPIVVSLDVPSGLDSDRATIIGDARRADLTVSFTAPKLANVMPPASGLGGELVVARIGSPDSLIDESPSRTFVTERCDAREWIGRTEFSSDSYKNKRGHVLLVAGSPRYAGAAVLAANAAMVSGAGLVTVATGEAARIAFASRLLPEVMTVACAANADGALVEEALPAIESIAARGIQAVAVGSGLSAEDESTRNLVARIVAGRLTPVVVDADGLNALAPFALEPSDLPPLVLTPHEGEFLRLLGTDDRSILDDRIGAARGFATRHRVFLVLKGERVLIAAPDGRVAVNPTGNAGLGKAGNGDTLTGILAGFLAQAAGRQVGVFETLAAAVYLAGLAGDIAEKEFGKRTMVASDVRVSLAAAFAEVAGEPERR